MPYPCKHEVREHFGRDRRFFHLFMGRQRSPVGFALRIVEEDMEGEAKASRGTLRSVRTYIQHYGILSEML